MGSFNIPGECNLTRQAAFMMPPALSPFFWLHFNNLVGTWTNVKNKEIEIEGMKIEEVNSPKYLGTIMIADNLIEEEIKERIAAGNRSFFANKKIFQTN